MRKYGVCNAPNTSITMLAPPTCHTDYLISACGRNASAPIPATALASVPLTVRILTGRCIRISFVSIANGPSRSGNPDDLTLYRGYSRRPLHMILRKV